MYDENTFKNYIFWLKVRRIFVILVLSCLGSFIGVTISQFVIDVLLLLDASYKILIIAGSTLLFFAISLLLTAGTGKEVQDAYWKIAVLRKLTVISKKLDISTDLPSSEDISNNIEKLTEDLIDNSDLEDNNVLESEDEVINSPEEPKVETNTTKTSKEKSEIPKEKIAKEPISKLSKTQKTKRTISRKVSKE